MSYYTIICKLGGKILEDLENIQSTISQISQLIESNIVTRIILIPGGGTYANFVRELYDTLDLDEDLAHWMGIISMDHNGRDLKKKFPELTLIDDFNKLVEFTKGISVFLPFKFLRKTDELPHNWDVTSDSITLYLAKMMKLEKCYLIKNVDGIYNESMKIIRKITTQEVEALKKAGNLTKTTNNLNRLKMCSEPIDNYLTYLIELYNIPCFIINGNADTRRISDFFDKSLDKEDRVYTKIVF